MIGLSPLPTSHPSGFQPTPVRASTRCYPSFTLLMGRSPWLRVYAHQLLAPVTGLAFAPAPPQSGLASLVSSNSPDHNAKGTQSGRPKTTLLPLVGTRFQDLFHSPPGVLFTFPSRYSCTIGRQLVLSLTRWSSQIHTGFPGSRVTREHHREVIRFRVRGRYPLWRTFPECFH